MACSREAALELMTVFSYFSPMQYKYADDWM